MDIDLIWAAHTGTALLAVAVTLAIVIFKQLSKKHREKVCRISGVEILELLRNSKIFPLVHGSVWRLYDFCYDMRIWKGRLTSDVCDNIVIHGCFSKVKGSSQVVLKTLKDLEKYPEWQPKLARVTAITRAHEAPPAPRMKNTPSLPVQHDCISLETDTTNSRLISAINWLSRRIQGEPLLQKLIKINRYWHREDNGCCWMLEVTEADGEWTFYLAQPVEEMDQCLLTIVQAPSVSRGAQGAVLTAYRLASLQNYFLYRKVQCTPLLTVSLPSSTEEAAPEEEDIPDNAPPSKVADVAPEHKEERPPKPELTLLQRFRSLIDEKREWYEERKRKQNLTSNSRRSSIDVVHWLPGGSRGKEGSEETDSDVSENTETSSAEGRGARDTFSPGEEHLRSDREKPRVERKSILKLLRASNMPVSAEGRAAREDVGREVDKTAMVTLTTASSTTTTTTTMTTSAPTRQASSILKRKSMDSGGGRMEEVMGAQGDMNSEKGKTQDVVKEVEDDKMVAGIRVIANATAAEIMAEKVKVSNIDIGRSHDEQATLTGGWIYCGLEKDVVILRKVVEDNAPIQSYLGKGIIPVPPKAVFEALKNPRTRFTYDEMLKKVDILRDFGGGLKVVYMYHEASQLFRKEARDFCVLQSERIEGFKYIISLKSIGWPECVESEDVTRGKFHSSGWIIEPANRDNKLYSMVTYIVQIELGFSKTTSGYLVEELAAKQPLSIAHIRAYLAPGTTPRLPPSADAAAATEQRRTSVPAPMGTLAAAAAFASKGSLALHKSASTDL